MSDIAIRVENLSKMYRIGRAQQRHDTTSATLSAGLRHALVAGLRAPLERLSSFVHRLLSDGDERRTKKRSGHCKCDGSGVGWR